MRVNWFCIGVLMEYSCLRVERSGSNYELGDDGLNEPIGLVLDVDVIVLMLGLEVLQVVSSTRLIYIISTSFTVHPSTWYTYIPPGGLMTGMSQFRKHRREEKRKVLRHFKVVRRRDANASSDRQRHHRAACVTDGIVHVILLETA